MYIIIIVLAVLAYYKVLNGHFSIGEFIKLCKNQIFQMALIKMFIKFPTSDNYEEMLFNRNHVYICIKGFFEKKNHQHNKIIKAVPKYNK